MRRLLSLCSLMLFAGVLLAGCASNSVRLLYSPSDPGSLPAPSAKQVVVVMFDDKRDNQSLGIRNNGTVFAASSSVPDWVSRSLGDALFKLGTPVSYAMTMAEAKRAKPAYIVTGVIHEVWLQEQSATSINATIRLTVTMNTERGTVLTETMTASQERKGVLTSSDIENLLVDTLRGITGPMARKINDAL